jgi:hypothetical protein
MKQLQQYFYAIVTDNEAGDSRKVRKTESPEETGFRTFRLPDFRTLLVAGVLRKLAPIAHRIDLALRYRTHSMIGLYVLRSIGVHRLYARK